MTPIRRAGVRAVQIAGIGCCSALLWLMVGCATPPAAARSPVAAALAPARTNEVYVLAKSALSWDGARLPAYPQGQPEITMLRILIPAGATLARHKHPVINAGYLVRGELTVKTDDGKVLHLKAGQALVEVVETWHYGRNEGAEPAEIVVFYAGTVGAPITVH